MTLVLHDIQEAWRSHTILAYLNPGGYQIPFCIKERVPQFSRLPWLIHVLEWLEAIQLEVIRF